MSVLFLDDPVLTVQCFTYNSCALPTFKYYIGPEERETLVAVISVQGKKRAKDYADNYCVEKNGPFGIQDITQDFSSCLVRMLRILTSS